MGYAGSLPAKNGKNGVGRLPTDWQHRKHRLLSARHQSAVASIYRSTTKEMPHVPHHGHTRKRFAQDASRQYGLFSMTCFSRFNKYESDLILGIKVMKQTNKDNKGSLCQAREREK